MPVPSTISSPTVYLVSGVAPEPSVAATQSLVEAPGKTSPPPRARDDKNASCVPSREKTGCILAALTNLVSGVAPEPSAFITQRLKPGPAVLLPSNAAAEVKAIFLPSWDQAGDAAPATPSSRVRGFMPVPSALASQIFCVEFAVT